MGFFIFTNKITFKFGLCNWTHRPAGDGCNGPARACLKLYKSSAGKLLFFLYKGNCIEEKKENKEYISNRGEDPKKKK